MTTFNTGNPLGSSAVKDLYDNAENLDTAVNDVANETWVDRLGVTRKTFYGMEQDFQQFLIDSGYVNIGDYAAGLEITARNQTFWRDGELYRAGASLDLPYTTTGDWASEESLFVATGDRSLRQDLSNVASEDGKGAAMIGYTAPDGTRKTVSEFADDDGASLISYKVQGAGSTARTISQKINQIVRPEDFGAVGDGVSNDGEALVAALSTGNDLVLSEGAEYLMDGYTLVPSNGQRIIGPGTLHKTNTTDGGGNGSYTNPFIQILNVSDVDVSGVKFFMPPGARRLAITIEDSSRVRISGCRSLGNETFCFIWKGSAFVSVTDNITSGGQFGIATGGDVAGNTDGLVTDIIIANNIFSYASSEGIDINWDTQRCSISGNILFSNNQSGPGPNTDELDIGGGACREITVINNIIDGGGISNTGIMVKKNPTVATQYVNVIGNVIRNLDTSETSGRGIRFTNSHNGLIEGNVINGAYRGIQVDTDFANVAVRGNRISGITAEAINSGVVVSQSRNSGLIVSDNIISSSGGGIFVTDIVDFKITGNMVNLTTAGSGIHTDIGEIGIISDNIIRNAAMSGINTGTRKTNIVNNSVSGSGSAGISSIGTHCRVSGNSSFNNGRTTSGSYGIQIGAGANYARICENHIYDDQGTKTQNGLRFIGASDRCIVSDNISFGNMTTQITGQTTLTNSVLVNNITS